MTVRHVALAGRDSTVTGVGYDPHGALRVGDEEPDCSADRVLMDLCRAAVLCHDAEFAEAPGEIKLEGDPTEGALGVLGLKAGLETSRLRADHPRDDTIPFESERRFMATLHHDHKGRRFIFVKGAPERVVFVCTNDRPTARR